MQFIALIAVIGILLLQWTGSIPLASVGGPLVIALAFFAAALAVAIHEAWTQKRGVLGWIVNIVLAFLGALMAANPGSLLVMIILFPFMDAPSLAATGGAVMSFALAGMMGVTLLGAWGAIWIVNKWRDKKKEANSE